MNAPRTQPMQPNHTDADQVIAALRAENRRLREALENMVHAFGAFANTPKENRCMPTQRECNQRQSWAMQQARAALKGE